MTYKAVPVRHTWPLDQAILTETSHHVFSRQSANHSRLIGGFLGVSALILFPFAWNQASVVGWQESYTYALLIVGFVLMVAFVVFQSHVAAPVLLNSLWTRRGFFPAVTAMSFGWMSPAMDTIGDFEDPVGDGI